MKLRDMDRLWDYQYLSQNLITDRGMHRTRHIRWDPETGGLFYIVRRSNPTQVEAESGTSQGRYAVAEDALSWITTVLKRPYIKVGYVVLVNPPTRSGLPPEIVYYCTVKMMWDSLYDVEPRIGQDGNKYWWVEADGTPYLASGGFYPGTPVTGPVPF